MWTKIRMYVFLPCGERWFLCEVKSPFYFVRVNVAEILLFVNLDSD